MKFMKEVSSFPGSAIKSLSTTGNQNQNPYRQTTNEHRKSLIEHEIHERSCKTAHSKFCKIIKGKAPPGALPHVLRTHIHPHGDALDAKLHITCDVGPVRKSKFRGFRARSWGGGLEDKEEEVVDKGGVWKGGEEELRI